MRIYTNIPPRKDLLDHAKKLLGEQRVTWSRHPSVNVNHPVPDQYNAIMKSREILVAEKIGFIVFTVSYKMEGHVDRSDLYNGHFTNSENLSISGYTKKLGEFSAHTVLNTGIPARHFGSLESYLTEEDWERIGGSILLLSSLTPSRKV